MCNPLFRHLVQCLFHPEKTKKREKKYLQERILISDEKVGTQDFSLYRNGNSECRILFWQPNPEGKDFHFPESHGKPIFGNCKSTRFGPYEISYLRILKCEITPSPPLALSLSLFQIGCGGGPQLKGGGCQILKLADSLLVTKHDLRFLVNKKFVQIQNRGFSQIRLVSFKSQSYDLARNQ